MTVRTGPIRYATASRFGLPQIADSAESSGQICPQPPSRLEHIMGPQKDARPQGEDCLNLSITTPALDSGRRPVLVWLHGGGFTSGSGLFDWYDGSALSSEGDVVVVSVNYRLGALGYLCLDGVSPGNLGLHDQISALRWVQANISRYGGDPNQVTVFGQSAGGMSIRMLLGLPENLFHRAILQSAPVGLLSETDASTVGKMFAAHLDSDPFTASVAEILQAQKETAVQHRQTAANRMAVPFGPVALPDPVLQVRDLLVGWNTDEETAFPGSSTERDFASPLRTFANQLQTAGGTVHSYELSWRPSGSEFGATHCVELPLLLGSEHAWRGSPMLGNVPWREVDTFGRALRADWITFAHTGIPGTQATDWPMSYTPIP